MTETVDRAVYEVKTRRVGDRSAVTGIRDEMLSTQQVQRAAQEGENKALTGKLTMARLASPTHN